MEMTLHENVFNIIDTNELIDINGDGLFSKICSTIGCVLIGTGGVVGGICLMAVPEPTTATKVGGWAAITVGVGSFFEIPAIWG